MAGQANSAALLGELRLTEPGRGRPREAALGRRRSGALWRQNMMRRRHLLTHHAASLGGGRPRPGLVSRAGSLPPRADAVLDYLDFARRYVADCEERYGLDAVEDTLDAAARADEPGRRPHAQDAPRRLAEGAGAPRRQPACASPRPRREYDDLWRTLPRSGRAERRTTRRAPGRPQSARPARGKPALLHREERAAPGGLAARAAAHRPHAGRSISTPSARPR
jgi:hypothetical protein